VVRRRSDPTPIQKYPGNWYAKVFVPTFAETEDILGLALQGLARGLPAWCTNADSDVRRGYALP